jgi:hypothetical protein
MPNVEEEAKGDDADIDEESDDQVSPTKHALEFES